MLIQASLPPKLLSPPKRIHKQERAKSEESNSNEKHTRKCLPYIFFTWNRGLGRISHIKKKASTQEGTCDMYGADNGPKLNCWGFVDDIGDKRTPVLGSTMLLLILCLDLTSLKKLSYAAHLRKSTIR